MINFVSSVVAFTVCMAVLSSCQEENSNTYAPPPPTIVDVGTPEFKDLLVYDEFPARTRPSEVVEIRARASGILESRAFEEGGLVEKDGALFTIEKEVYESELAMTRVKLSQAEAAQEIALVDYKKKKQAHERSNAVPEIEVLKAAAETKASAADVAGAKLAIQDAELSLSYTTIKSPIAGRVSKSEYSIGSLVGTGEPTLLATVVQDDPLYVDFEVNERVILPFLEVRNEADHEKPSKKLRLKLTDGSFYGEDGAFDFLDNQINPATGSISIRAAFPNPNGKLAGGLFVRIGIPVELKGAVLVPDSVIMRDLGGAYVYLLQNGDTVERRNIELTTYKEGRMQVVAPYDEESQTGIKSGESLIISNLQKIRGGMKVLNSAHLPSAAKPTAPATEE